MTLDNLPNPNLTIGEVASLIKLSDAAVRNLVRDRRIGHYRIGKRLMFTVEDVATFLEGRRCSPLATAGK